MHENMHNIMHQNMQKIVHQFKHYLMHNLCFENDKINFTVKLVQNYTLSNELKNFAGQYAWIF